MVSVCGSKTTLERIDHTIVSPLDYRDRHCAGEVQKRMTRRILERFFGWTGAQKLARETPTEQRAKSDRPTPTHPPTLLEDGGQEASKYRDTQWVNQLVSASSSPTNNARNNERKINRRE